MIQTHRFGTKFRKIFAHLDPVMVAVLLLISIVSLVTMYSASTDRPDRFFQHARNLVVCWGVIFVVSYIKPQVFMRVAVPIYVLGVLLLIAVAVAGEVRLGARRWIFGFQPSELLKLAVPMMVAYYFQTVGNASGKALVKAFLLATLMIAVPFLLIARQPDLGTGLLVVSAGAFIIYYAGLSWKIVGGLLGLAVVSVPIAYKFLLHDYQRTRIDTLLDPTKDPRGTGFHILQAKTAIGSGGILGKGWMDGSQAQLQFIPEKSTDFLLAVYAEEFGLIGVMVLLVLYFMLISRGLSIANQAQTKFDRLLAGALSMIIFTYVFVNMGMVAGILPVVGVPLPFMSYGGTALVTLGVACGMLMSIRHHRIR